MEDAPEIEEDEEYTGGVVKKFMYVNRRAPHGTIYAQESLEVVLVGAAFDQDVSVVFIDDGVYQIRKDQDTSAIGTKNFSKTFRVLEMYDVEKLYVEKESMQARGMTEDDLNVPVEVKTSEEIGRLMEEQDVVLSF
jgi:tRNA 2-thiouridine synthesizing protein C